MVVTTLLFVAVVILILATITHVDLLRLENVPTERAVNGLILHALMTDIGLLAWVVLTIVSRARG